MYKGPHTGEPDAIEQIPGIALPDETGDPRQAMVISPHIDDAAFSLAATLKLLVRAGSTVRIVNCFTLTGFAPFADGNERLTVITRRRHEEELFLHHLGGNSRSDDLGLEDAPARTGLGVRAVLIQPSSFRDIATTTPELVDSLEEAGSGTAVLAPLAIGNHPDHHIARQAALEKYRHVPIAFYEDLPYAASATRERIAVAVRETAAKLNESLQAIQVRWPGDSLWKQQCCSYYKSQISQTGIQKILNYMQSNNGERLWCSERFVNAWKKLSAGSGCLMEQEQCLAELY
jgi:LmbE family N-acetylglucosaminyl deacetylase